MTTAVNGPLGESRARQRRAAPTSKNRASHLSRIDAADAARAMGVQVRALCGVWIWPNATFVGSVADTGTTSQTCRRCYRSLERLRRERALGR